MESLPEDRAKNGRPTAYCEDIAGKIIDAVRSGLTMERAAELVGMNAGTIQGWVSKRPTFGRAVKRARREHEISLLRSIELAGEKSWQARAWILERAHGYAQPSSRLSVDTSVTHGVSQGFAQLLAGLASRRAEKKAQVIEAEEVKQLPSSQVTDNQLNNPSKYNTYCATNKDVDSQEVIKVRARKVFMKRRKPRAESLAKYPPTTTPHATPPAAVSDAYTPPSNSATKQKETDGEASS